MIFFCVELVVVSVYVKRRRRMYVYEGKGAINSTFRNKIIADEFYDWHLFISYWVILELGD